MTSKVICQSLQAFCSSIAFSAAFGTNCCWPHTGIPARIKEKGERKKGGIEIETAQDKRRREKRNVFVFPCRADGILCLFLFQLIYGKSRTSSPPERKSVLTFQVGRRERRAEGGGPGGGENMTDLQGKKGEESGRDIGYYSPRVWGKGYVLPHDRI